MAAYGLGQPHIWYINLNIPTLSQESLVEIPNWIKDLWDLFLEWLRLQGAPLQPLGCLKNHLHKTQDKQPASSHPTWNLHKPNSREPMGY